MEKGIMSLTVIASWILFVFCTGVRGQFEIKTASTTPTEGNAIVACSPASNLLIRTAHYLATPPLTRDEQLSSDDVMKIYRHCSRDINHCDVSTAGIERQFIISYYCLKDPLINPCSNVTEDSYSDQFALLINYPRHKTARETTCQCDVISPRNHTLYIRALNTINYVHNSIHHDIDDTASKPGEKSEGRGLPKVLIDYDWNQWQWEVERGSWPVGWQLRMQENTSLSLLFDHVHGIEYGRTWVDFRDFRSSWFIIYASVASSVGAILLVICLVTVARCARRRSLKVHNVSSWPSPGSDHNNCPPEGEYCTINEFGPRPNRMNANAPRDPGPPISEETSFVARNDTTADRSTGRRPRGQDSHCLWQIGEGMSQPAGCNAGPRVQTTPDEYQSLSYRPVQPSATQQGEAVVYNLTGVFTPSGEEAEYHQLKHCVRRQQPRVIDNVYDTANYVKKS